MTLPASPPISFSQVITEFSGPSNLLSYFRGGAYVPDSPVNAGVPTSGTLSLLNFLGAADVTGVLITVTAADSGSLDGGGSGLLLRGFISGSFGSISPTTADGNTILRLVRYDEYSSFVYIGSVLEFRLSGAFAQNEFQSLTFNGTNYLTSAATFTSSNTWQWGYAVEGVTNISSTYYF